MDDVLDRFCILYLHRDIHRYIFVMVSLLLRNKSYSRDLAFIASNQRKLNALSQVRTSDVDET